MTDSLLELALQIPEFSRLWNKWSREHVTRYINTLCTTENCAETLEKLQKEDQDGLRVAYHERVELDEMEALFNQHIREDRSFYDLLDSGDIQTDHLFFKVPGDGLINNSYLEAHGIALEKEKQFVQQLQEMI